MRKFYTLAGILSLSDEEKELIRQQALEGDPVSCYKLAEIHLHLHDCEDYVAYNSTLMEGNDAIPDDEPLDEDEDIDDDGRFDAWA